MFWAEDVELGWFSLIFLHARGYQNILLFKLAFLSSQNSTLKVFSSFQQEYVWPNMHLGLLTPTGDIIASQMALVVKKKKKNTPANAGDFRDAVWFLSWEDLLEEEMTTHSSIPAWRIPWTEEPGGLWSTGSQRVWHDRSDLARTGETNESECYEYDMIQLPKAV